MSTNPGARPDPVSERLKQLDAAASSSPLPEFDVDAAIRGGRRRQRRLTAASLLGTAAAVAAVSTALALGSPGRSDSPTAPAASPTPTAPATSAPTSGPAPADGDVDSEDPAVTYTQDGDTVTARKDGAPVATITVTGLSRSGSGGHVDLDVTPVRPITLEVRDFVWEDDQGQQQPLDPQRVLYVDTPVRGLTIDYAGVGGGGGLVWAPGNDVAGRWPAD